MKAKFALLCAFFAILATFVSAQSTDNFSVKVTVVDGGLNLKNVPKFALVIRREGDAGELKVATDANGQASASLPPGDYVLVSERPLKFEDRSYSWEQQFSVTSGKLVTIELSSDNAKITDDAAAPINRRDISRGGEMFSTLREGVVTVQGELGAGTGFIIDNSGLILTNQHVIDQSFEVRVRFDKNTAVKARVLAVDEDRDLAVLQVNLSVFSKSKVLNIASKTSAEPPIIEGERVFTIGSPLNQEKILSSGIASKIEPRAIITDIFFNQGNSGAPLFNSVGDVVGITTFKIRDRSGAVLTGNKIGEETSGLSGIVAIDEAAEVIAKAKAVAATRALPSPQLMPNMPDGVFPVDTIKAAFKDKNYPLKDYLSDVKNYEIKYMTPVYKFYLMEKDRVDSLKARAKRNKDDGLADTTADAFRDLRYWSEYAGELQPVVQILALPETGATAGSMVLSALAQSTVGFSTPLSQKYKADFYQMKLMCNGQEVTPLIRNKTEIARELQNYYKQKRHYTYAGIYSYPYEVFAPGRCQQMQVHIFSEEDIETPIVSDVSEVTKNRIWADFKDFRDQKYPVRP